MATPIPDLIHRWTSDPLYGLSGTNYPDRGGLLEVTLNGVVYRSPIDPVTGFWHWVPPYALPDNEYVITARFHDKAGNIGDPLVFLLHVDTTAPEPPRILIAWDDEGSLQDFLTPGARTDDKTPTLIGNAEPESVVHLYDNSRLIGSAKADIDGSWEITPTLALAAGQHSFTVTATDRLDHTSARSQAFALTIESDGNDQPARIDFAADDVGPVQHDLRSGDKTDDTTPTLHGSAPANSTLYLQYRSAGGSWSTRVLTADSEGSWSWIAPTLNKGDYEFRVQKAGDSWSSVFKLTIDPELDTPLKPVIEGYSDDVGSVTGDFGAGSKTDDNTPTLFGSGAKNSTIYIRYQLDSGTYKYAEAATDSSGKWSWTPPTKLALGEWAFAVKNAADSAYGNPFDLTIVAESGHFSNNIDFESWSNNDFSTVYSNANLSLHNGLLFITSGPQQFSKNSYNSSLPEDYGSASIRFNNLAPGSSLSYQIGLFPDHSNTKPKYIDKFGVDVYNPYHNAAKVYLFLSNYDNGPNEKTLQIPLELVKGNNHFRFADLSELAGFDVTSARLKFYNDGYHPNTDGLVFDNFSYEFKKSGSFDISSINELPAIYDDVPDDALNTYPKLDENTSTQKGDNTEELQNSTSTSDTLQPLNEKPLIELASILQHGEANLLIDDDKIQLLIADDDHDELQLNQNLLQDGNIEDWIQQQGNITVANIEYKVYTHINDGAEILVPDIGQTDVI